MDVYDIVTGRFNNKTWEKNALYRSKNGIPCIYACPFEIAATVDPGLKVFVLEMNNDTNQLIGVGIIKNQPTSDRYYRVQENADYNRFIYQGKSYKSRESLDPTLVLTLDKLLFRGKSHSKRGGGLLRFPHSLRFTIEGRGLLDRLRREFLPPTNIQ
jgi:hypothetical protein